MPVPPSHRPTVVACLSAWKAGASGQWRQIAANIEEETVPSAGEWDALFEAFAGALEGAMSDPETCWIQICYGHQLRGPPVPAPLPPVLGRAVPLSAYAKVVSESPDIEMSPEACSDLLLGVAADGARANPRQTRVLRKARVGRHLIWATFCPHAPADSPFEHLPRTTAAIRTALGLGECAEAERLLLLTYRNEADGRPLELFRPTVCDAAAYSWFRPHSDPGAPHGMTCPLDPNAHGLPPQPEVVHREITGEHLLLPLHLAV